MERLDAISIPPASGGPVRQVVLAMHGYGGDAGQFVPVMRRWADDLPDAELVALHGPAPCALQPQGREWFPLTNLPSALHARAAATAPLIEAFIDDVLTRHGLGSERLALAGFSQGAVMSLYLGMRRRPVIGAIVSFAGVLTGADELAPIGDRPKVLLVQGTLDRMVRIESMHAAQAALGSCGAQVECLIRDGGQHEIDEIGTRGAGDFLRRALADRPAHSFRCR
jgi:phospholipase/carboxylesterase